jgi:hypothetical protein
MFQRLTSAGAGLLVVASVMFAQSMVSRPKFDEFEVASMRNSAVKASSPAEPNPEQISGLAPPRCGTRVCGKTTHDAGLVAAMVVHGVKHILTFKVDDFARYTRIEVLHPAKL